MSAQPRFSVVSNEIPSPPYPAETRAKGMMFDIDVERLYQSKTWLIASPDMKPWLLRLWVESWRSIPVGTFDDDDELIAARIMMPEPLFQAHRKTLMRGWVRHADGLLYHPVITELVVNLITWRDRERERKRQYREKMSRGTGAGQVGQRRGQVGQDDTSSSSSSSSNNPLTPLRGKFELPPSVDPSVWAEFEAHRKEIRKPLTDLARTKNANVLALLTREQQRASVDESIRNRWTGVFPPKGLPVPAASSARFAGDL